MSDIYNLIGEVGMLKVDDFCTLSITVSKYYVFLVSPPLGAVTVNLPGINEHGA